ncbi:unnamed protein product [Clonostachys rosea]|uniref:Uncharacterized protein n=1 Tax=Bionectria ochroleuca TaxID=29856 RepID=A0ABY6V419_BIOOC|nr:unnamed protein product [Clonostachys rosea]
MANACTFREYLLQNPRTPPFFRAKQLSHFSCVFSTATLILLLCVHQSNSQTSRVSSKSPTKSSRRTPEKEKQEEATKMASPETGINSLLNVFDMDTESWLSAEEMCHIQSHVIASLNAITMGPNGSNYQDTYDNWSVVYDMHGALFFNGVCFDYGWELPYDWRSIPINPDEFDAAEYIEELQILAQKYADFIQAQAGVIDALIMDQLTMRRMILPFDEEDVERVRQDKLKQFWIGNDDEIEAAIAMQSKLSYILEENLFIIEEWIFQLMDSM